MGSSATSVRERPILFSGAMVRALLDARKTVTRRVVKITHRTPGLAAALLPPAGIAPRPHVAAELCPYGQPGDRLWVREGWGYEPWTEESERRVLYRASTVDGDRTMRWRPSIHMPRWASRITLEITEVRVERVQEITNGDALAEGMNGWGPPRTTVPFEEFARLWDSLNASRGYGWDANPWVWVITFRRVDA